MRTKKGFDCVKVMRDIRDEMSRTIQHMTFEEQAAWLRSQLEKDYPQFYKNRKADAQPARRRKRPVAAGKAR